MPFVETGQFKTWFHFKVSGVQPSQVLTFTIKQMNFQGKLFSSGLKPVYKIDGVMKNYKRIPGDLVANVRNFILIILDL